MTATEFRRGSGARNFVAVSVLRELVLPVLLYGSMGLWFTYQLGRSLAALIDHAGFPVADQSLPIVQMMGSIALIIVCAGQLTRSARQSRKLRVSPSFTTLFYAGLAVCVVSFGASRGAEICVLFGIVHGAIISSKENAAISVVLGGGVLIVIATTWSIPAVVVVVIAFAVARCLLYLLARYEEMYRVSTEGLHTATSAIAEMTRENNQLRARYEASVSSIIHSERKRIALEIHDTVGHSLTLLLRKAELLRDLANTEGCGEPPEVDATNARFREFENSIRDCIGEMRREVRSLRVAREEVDWVENSRSLCDSFAMYSRVVVEFTLYDDLPQLSSSKGSAIYRIIQEALTNALRHGHAERVKVMLGLDNEGTTIYLKVSDDGLGCGAVVQGSGLSSIVTRARAQGGFVAWKTASLRGFDLGVEIPIDG